MNLFRRYKVTPSVARCLALENQILEEAEMVSYTFGLMSRIETGIAKHQDATKHLIG